MVANSIAASWCRGRPGVGGDRLEASLERALGVVEEVLEHVGQLCEDLRASVRRVHVLQSGLEHAAQQVDVAALTQQGLDPGRLLVVLGQGVERRLDQLVGLVGLIAVLGDRAQL